METADRRNDSRPIVYTELQENNAITITFPCTANTANSDESTVSFFCIFPFGFTLKDRKITTSSKPAVV